MAQRSLDAYWEVSDLVQQGRNDEARELAMGIPLPHLRGLALLLINHNQSLHGNAPVFSLERACGSGPVNLAT